jgi:hypothetical protein
MDWIEQLFGFAPDNGDGTLELTLTLAVIVVLAVVVFWKVPRARTAAARVFGGRAK